MIELRSTVFRAFPGTDSVRVTVPQALAIALGIEPGTVLVWTVVPGKLEARVRPEPRAEAMKRTSKSR